MRLRKLHNVKSEEERVNTSPLKNKEVENKFSQQLLDKTTQIRITENVEESWKAAVTEITSEVLKKETVARKKQM